MKLKTIVASLVALGLSAPVLAVQPYYMDTRYQLDVMRDQVNKVELIRDQNQPGGFAQPCGWTCRINVSGWINTDAYLANRPPVFFQVNPFSAPNGIDYVLVPTSGGRASDLLVNNANLFLDARVNNWVTANASLVYSSLTAVPGSQGFYALSNSLFTYHPVPSGGLLTRSIDTAFATVGNFRVSPLYFRVGKAYVPFGQYDPYAFVQSENPTQLITEINAPTAQLGFILSNGLYGAAFSFAGNPRIADANSTRRIQNGGMDLGYLYKAFDRKVNVEAGYVANIADANFLSAFYRNRFIENVVTATNSFNTGLPNEKTPAWNLNADMQFGPFDINGHYVAMTRNLGSPIYLQRRFSNPPNPSRPPLMNYKKPKVWGLEAGFTFPVKAHQSRIALGYQRTSHLVGLLPKQRMYADYLVNLAKWFDLGLAVFHDRDYSFNEGLETNAPVNGGILFRGGSGNKSTVGQLRASIKFA